MKLSVLRILLVIEDCIQRANLQVYKMAKKADGSLGDFSVAITFPKVTSQYMQVLGKL